MIFDSIVVALAILGAVALLVRYYMPRPQKKAACASHCGACDKRPP